MAEIDTYSPRKVTNQNRGLLPSTHDPEKRITYVQITLEEEEIAEAIRNYLRAQLPIGADDELPVDLIAGRGTNGHSASITVTAQPIKVVSPERPTEPLATFDEVNTIAMDRNGEGDETAKIPESEPETPQTAETVKPAVEETPQEAATEPVTTPTTEPVAETPATPPATTAEGTSEPVKSSLFETATPPATEPAAATKETVALTPNEAPAAPARKSIFD